MTLDAIRHRLIAIALSAASGDRERAIHCERRLHAEVLQAIAVGKAGAPEAREALRSLELQFPRNAA